MTVTGKYVKGTSFITIYSNNTMYVLSRKYGKWECWHVGDELDFGLVFEQSMYDKMREFYKYTGTFDLKEEDEYKGIQRIVLEIEKKQEILNLLCKALQATNNAHDLVALTYIPEAEKVEVEFPAGKRYINVAMDSGTAMIRDVVNHLGC